MLMLRERAVIHARVRAYVFEDACVRAASVCVRMRVRAHATRQEYTFVSDAAPIAHKML